jgi:tetratricopeptide (TPR) repeat protein
MNPFAVHTAAAAAVLAIVATSSVRAQEHVRRPEHDLLKYEVVYQLPAMERVTVQRDVPYKTVEGRTLTLDLYYPPDYTKGKALPAVLFINGVGDAPDAQLKVKDWGQYRSWPRLVAARGMIGISMESRRGDVNAADVRDALRWVRQDGKAKDIDPARTAAWACSANAGAAVPALMADGDLPARAAVIYYGGGEAATFRRDLPVLLVRAGRDMQFTNDLIARTIDAAIAANAPWTLINLPDLRHAFDCLDDNDDSRAAVARTLAFLEEQLAAANAAPLPAAAKARPVGGTPPEARAAMAHFFAREWEDAERAYSAWVAKHPDDGDAWLMLGNAQLEAKHADAARASLRRAVELLPRAGEGYVLLGKLEAERRNFDAAVPLLEKAVSFRPDNPEAHHQLGGIYLAQKRYPEATKELEAAVALAPGNGWAWSKLGIATLATGNAERAVESFQQVLKYAPNDPGLLYNLACAQARAGRPAEALASLSRSIDNGYKDRKNLLADTDLVSLHQEPRFAELVERLPE